MNKAPLLCVVLALFGCGGPLSDSADGGAAPDATQPGLSDAADAGQPGTVDSGPTCRVDSTASCSPDGGATSEDAPPDLSGAVDAGQLGTVDFVPIYESGSAWEDSGVARAMVDTVFADLESNLRTSGSWNATVEVFLTDDDPATANTSFEGAFRDGTVDGQSVRVVPAWALIVEGSADLNGAAEPDGSGAEFTVHFNVAGHEDNAGLLRHEVMHGLGAVTTIAAPTMSSSDEFTGPTVGERQKFSLYDLQLRDLDGNALVGNYDATTQTFEIQSYRLESTLMEWMDGSAGMSFRGRADDGGDYDMACGTFPFRDDLGGLLPNEPADLMSAGAHPSWHTLAEPDRAFFRAMEYQLAR